MKASAKNVREGAFRGMLEYDKRELVFRIGSNWFENTPIILQYSNTPLISCRLHDGQALVSINLYDSGNQLVLEIRDSEVVFRLDDIWDFECRKNVAIARSGPREIALKMDFSHADATIEGSLWAGGQLVKLGPDHTSLFDHRIKDNRMIDCCVGIQIDP